MSVRNIDTQMDFVHDQLYDGRRIRILTVIDTFTRYVPAIEVRERFTGADVVAVLEEIRKEIGLPNSIRVDQGPEFISKDLDLVQPPQPVPLIWPFSTNVSGAGARMPSAWCGRM